MTVTVTLSETLAASLSVPLEYGRSGDSATESTDYRGPGQVTIPAGATSGSGQISIEDDDITEGNEVFTVSLGRLPSELVAGSPRSVEITIQANDNTGIVVVPSSLNVTEGSAETYSVRLTSEPSADVTVQIPDFTNPDLTHDQSTLTFTPSTWDAPQTVTVRAAEDANAVDESESITLTASGGGYNGVTQVMTVTVIDSDFAGIELVPSSLNVTEGAAGTYSVRLLSEPAEPVTLNIVESAGIVSVSPLTLHFAVSDWDESQQVTVQADLDDNTINETTTLIHTATSADPDYSGTTGILPVTVIDRDVPHLVIDPGVLTMDEGSSAEFTVKLASEPTVPVAVEISTFTNPELTHDRADAGFYVVELGRCRKPSRSLLWRMRMRKTRLRRRSFCGPAAWSTTGSPGRSR